MASFVVMEPPAGDARRETRFIRDGFAVLAFIVPPLWFAWHRLWVEAIVSLALLVAAGALVELQGFAMASSLLSLLVSLYAGLEANGLRIAGLSRRGWREAGVVEAASPAEAELRWYHDPSASLPRETAPPPLPRRHPAIRSAAPAEGLGLIDYPGAR
ncbi:hypothetical protein CSC94_01090 [Zhengella mangrovi]|uniref:DUF2628 domain-containing protein n=1 Tax=Zhengella mangrovi TaxID=1982044 RepID=A0A2G1QT19_9HYPH|nr:DUF2628 domain-containing protein [Zhengella mangrovi]PHP68629.1 hypothetical protein CSC94_01090 [Zhengella mangrovi]